MNAAARAAAAAESYCYYINSWNTNDQLYRNKVTTVHNAIHTIVHKVITVHNATYNVVAMGDRLSVTRFWKSSCVATAFCL